MAYLAGCVKWSALGTTWGGVTSLVTKIMKITGIISADIYQGDLNTSIGVQCGRRWTTTKPATSFPIRAMSEPCSSRSVFWELGGCTHLLCLYVKMFMSTAGSAISSACFGTASVPYCATERKGKLPFESYGSGLSPSRREQSLPAPCCPEKEACMQHNCWIWAPHLLLPALLPAFLHLS